MYLLIKFEFTLVLRFSETIEDRQRVRSEMTMGLLENLRKAAYIIQLVANTRSVLSLYLYEYIMINRFLFNLFKILHKILLILEKNTNNLILRFYVIFIKYTILILMQF